MAENLTLSRPGAQNLGSDPAKMFRDVFTGEVLTAFDEHNIMKEPDAAKQAGYVTLIRLVLRVLETSIHLLGFTAPDRM